MSKPKTVILYDERANPEAGTEDAQVLEAKKFTAGFSRKELTTWLRRNWPEVPLQVWSYDDAGNGHLENEKHEYFWHGRGLKRLVKFSGMITDLDVINWVVSEAQKDYEFRAPTLKNESLAEYNAYQKGQELGAARAMRYLRENGVLKQVRIDDEIHFVFKKE